MLTYIWPRAGADNLSSQSKCYKRGKEKSPHYCAAIKFLWMDYSEVERKQKDSTSRAFSFCYCVQFFADIQQKMCLETLSCTKGLRMDQMAPHLLLNKTYLTTSWLKTL